MRIILITSLYPAFPNHSKMDVSYAVHYFAREWAKDNVVKVFRLWNYYPRLFALTQLSEKSQKYAFEEEFEIDEVNVHRIPFYKLPKIDYRQVDINRAANKILEILKKEQKPDLIICDILNPSLYIGEILAEKLGSKLVASLHNTDLRYLSSKNNRTKFLKTSKNISQIALRSHNVEKKFHNLINDDSIKEKSIRVLFGVNEKEIINKEKANEKIARHIKTFVIAAHLIKLKMIDIVIEAFARINGNNEYKLIIIGDGPERSALEVLVKKLHLQTQVYFHGEQTRENVLKTMEDADIFVMVSSPETFGLVYIEAMAKGCITIGSKGEGIDGVIIDGENGFLCAPGSVEELELTFRKILSLETVSKKNIIETAINTSIRMTNKNLAAEFLSFIE